MPIVNLSDGQCFGSSQGVGFLHKNEIYSQSFDNIVE